MAILSKEPNEVQPLIKTLEFKKATGPNNILTKFLKVFDKAINFPPSNLINF